METRYSDLSDFKDIGTVVFYGLRSFYPELHEVSDIDKTQVISDYPSTFRVYRFCQVYIFL